MGEVAERELGIRKKHALEVLVLDARRGDLNFRRESKIAAV